METLRTPFCLKTDLSLTSKTPLAEPSYRRTYHLFTRSIMSGFTRSLFPLTLCALTLLQACSSFVYDPPPEITLNRPQKGTFDATMPVTLTFNEPVDADSFVFDLWDPILTVEGEIPKDATPLVSGCSIAKSPCGGMDVSVTPITDGDKVTGMSISMPARGIASPGSTVVMQVLEGLADTEGNTAGASSFFNLQFSAPEGGRFNVDPVPFQNGTYIYSAVITDPVPAVLTLISDTVVMPDGRFYTAGGEGDEINGAPKETTNPMDLIVDPTDQGWAAHIAGFITLTEDGDRLLETDPVDLFLPTAPLYVFLNGVRMNGKIVKDENGDDRLNGSLSFETLELRIGELDAKPIIYDGGSQDLVGIFVPDADRPANHPFVCGDQCGAIIGNCVPPADFPASDVCAALMP